MLLHNLRAKAAFFSVVKKKSTFVLIWNCNEIAMEKPNFPGQNIQAKIDQEVPFLV
jgi:hypothetical protein